MSLYDQIEKTSQELQPGTYVAKLTKANYKTSKKGDPMIVLGLTADGHYLSKYIVMRPPAQQPARYWITDFAKVGLGMQDILAQGREDDLTLEQLAWLILDRCTKRVGAEIEIAVSFKPGEDLPNVSLRRLISEPPLTGEAGEDYDEDPHAYPTTRPAPDDEIPF
jgi:hypothetical protein